MEPSDDYESATTSSSSSSQQPIEPRSITFRSDSFASELKEVINNEVSSFNEAVGEAQKAKDYVDSVQYKSEIPPETGSPLPYENVKSKCSVSRKQDEGDCDVYNFALPFMTVQNVEQESAEGDEFFSADEIYHEPLVDCNTINQIGDSIIYNEESNSAANEKRYFHSFSFTKSEVPLQSTPHKPVMQFQDKEFPNILHESIRELALEGQFHDVILEAGQRKFRCHRLVLAAGSPYFRAMFCNGHRERNQSCIKIVGITDEIMKHLIRFAYTSHLEINPNNAQSLLEAGSFLQVSWFVYSLCQRLITCYVGTGLCSCSAFPRVVQACSDYFASQISVENAPGIMELAQRFSLQRLLVMARLECVTKFDKLEEKSDFINLSPTLLESIISRGDLSVKVEETVYNLVMKWTRHSPERKQHLTRLLQHVKLPLLDMMFFVRNVESDPLIACNSDVHDVLMECRMYHSERKISNLQRSIPRSSTDTQEVFLTIGGCDKNDVFTREVCLLDFQHKSRSSFCQLPSLNSSVKEPKPAFTKWAEFACCQWMGNLIISGGKETQKAVRAFLTSVRRWVELAELNTGRWRHRMVACKGELYVVGGYDGLLRVDSIEKYNRKDIKWQERKAMREGVSSAAICVANEEIYVFGGGPSVKIATEKVQVYNPENDEWRLATSMPEPSKCISACSIGNKIFVVGGTLRNVLQFDIVAQTWSRGACLHYERASCGLTICSGKIFIVGGRAENGTAVANVSYVDLEAGVVRSECNMPWGLSHHGCITLYKYDSFLSSRTKLHT